MARSLLLLAWLATSAGVLDASAQTAAAAAANGVTTNLPASGWIALTDPIVLEYSPASVGNGRVAVFIDRTDWTSLFAYAPRGLSYQPGALTLPPGEHELIVYVVSSGNVWTEQARFPLKVRTRSGFEKADTAPAVDIGVRAQLFEGHTPEENAPERRTFRDFTVNPGFRTTLVRNGVQWDLDGSAVGVSWIREALRFGEQGENAPQFDLASYSAKVSLGRASAQVGHLAFGRSRHLINGFASRGITVTTPLGKRADASFMIANATSIVGWSNVIGLAERQHRVIAGSVGVELIASRPAGLRFEGTVMTGSRLPATNYTQGAVTDAETSRGLSGRVLAADAKNRLRVDAGYTRSRFTNPLDPLLAQGTPLVDVQETARNARYLDASFDVLQNAAIGKRHATLTAVFRHERVDPLFRSVAGAAAADRQENAIELQGLVGQMSFQAGHMQMHDNLGEIASILTTNTSRNSATAAVPLGSASAPRITYTLERIHQSGTGIPVNSDFSATHVPDQMSLNQTVGLEWQRSIFRTAYRFGRASVDNRNAGQERADSIHYANGVTAAVSVTNVVDLTGDVSIDRSHNMELSRVDRTRRVAITGDWRVTPRVGVIGNISRTWTDDEPATSASQSTELMVEGYWQMAFRKTPKPKPAMRLFGRYNRQFGRIENRQFGVPLTLREGWTVNAGVNVSVF